MPRVPEIVGEVALELDCSRGEEPVVGAVLRLSMGAGPSAFFEVVRVGKYRKPMPATHFVRLRRRRAYLED